MTHPVTPDGRYFVVRGRLWRMANPGLDDAGQAAAIQSEIDAIEKRARAEDATGTRKGGGWS
jgi:hypothetical protein